MGSGWVPLYPRPTYVLANQAQIPVQDVGRTVGIHVTSTGKRRDISKSGHEKPRVDDNHWYISCVDHNTLERLRTLKNERGIHFAVDGYRV